MRKATSSLAHYSMPPTSGYSSKGCSPAEPISASPDTLCPRYVGWFIIVPPEIRVSTLLNQRIKGTFHISFVKQKSYNNLLHITYFPRIKNAIFFEFILTTKPTANIRLLQFLADSI
jgi:hypothetical protein